MSAGTVALAPEVNGTFYVPQITADSRNTANKLLQENHDKFHMYFNDSGFHNHIAHHLLAALALGAASSQLQTDYDANVSYQRDLLPVKQENVQSMADPNKFKDFLNNRKYFHDYEVFFQQEIDAANGNWGNVLHKHLFSKTEQADDMLIRMYAGLYHPLIHLGYGVEFRQPAIIAEAMAQAATHDNWPGKYLLKTSSKAREAAKEGKPTKSLFQLLKEARANDKIRNAARPDDGSKLRDGIIGRAADEMSTLASQWRINDPNDPVELRRKTAEMINANMFFAAGAQHASHKKQIKFDFMHIHCTNSSIFFSAFLDPVNDSWLSNEDRARMIEFKGWNDLAVYSCGTPELFVDEINQYQPKQPNDGWAELFARIVAVADDGHASKLVRAIANGHKVCMPLENELDKTVLPIRGEKMWLTVAHMAVDSVEGASSRWVRFPGFEDAWKDVPDRDKGFPDGAQPGKGQVNGEHYPDPH